MPDSRSWPGDDGQVGGAAPAPDRAFELFTRKIGEWWPADRRHTQDPESRIFLLESGRFYECARDGREVKIAFAAKGGGTEMTVMHRPKPSSAALWTERALRYARSWDALLTALSQAAA